MQFKDYYETLGVKSDAAEADIKSAYRRLARKYHPDVSKEAGAEEKFKAVNEAYEALKDPERRRSYDQLRSGGYRGGDDFRPPPGWQTRGGPDGGFAAHGDAADQEAFSDFFESLFGNRGGARGGAPRPRRGNDLHAHFEIDLAIAFSGGRERVTLRDPVQGERTLEIGIPAGILPGQQIRLAGQGYPGMQGGPAGDLLLEIGIRNDPRFRLDGRDVLIDLPLAPWEAGLGAKITVPTLSGDVDLRVPAGSDSGRKLRLRGRGMPGSNPGDQFVTLQVRVPAAKTAAERELYENMKGVFDGFDPRGQ